MEKFTNVMSSADKVEALEITEETVIVRSGITHVEDPGTEDQPGFTGWKIETEEVYEKDEYIKLMAEKMILWINRLQISSLLLLRSMSRLFLKRRCERWLRFMLI